MKKLIVIVLVIALFIGGVMLGSNKTVGQFIDKISGDKDTAQDTPADELHTWYAADLPGAEQLCFYSFSEDMSFTSSDDYDPYGGLYLGGLNGCTANTDNGYLEVRVSDEAVNPYLVLFASPDITDVDAVLGYSADVLVVDFDIWFPQGTPDCLISDYFNVSRDYQDFAFALMQGSSELYGKTATSGEQSVVYSLNTYNEYSSWYDSLSADLGLDFSRRYHITLMIFGDQLSGHIYVNGQYVSYLNFAEMPFYNIVFDGLVIPISPTTYVEDESGSRFVEGEALEYGSFCLDSFEIVRFGNGDGSYDGLLRSYQTNTSLDLSDLLGG